MSESVGSEPRTVTGEVKVDFCGGGYCWNDQEVNGENSPGNESVLRALAESARTDPNTMVTGEAIPLGTRNAVIRKTLYCLGGCPGRHSRIDISSAGKPTSRAAADSVEALQSAVEQHLQ